MNCHGGEFAVRCDVKICNENLVAPAAEFTRFRMAGDFPRGAVRLDAKFALLAGEKSESLHEGTYFMLDDLEIVPASPEAGRDSTFLRAPRSVSSKTHWSE